ncbi:DUF167 domain-containing protein [Cryobacterium sp. TMT1-3]|uniref:DUF167 domain-containing protein n=1 Tax=Cryobacterium luteum TaxID=1424661 RepID=A0A5F0D3A1_9MICO|nr:MULTISPECIES: DUF167 domain-containing protein [Cryobacterium]TFB87821.1 DUF167 domain-containing protein [Cryobacterium luteum]TFC30618.1 DUF167 domain-containing protein [Cryobacterium sp. TMT1-3]
MLNLTVHVKPGSRKGPLVVDDPDGTPDHPSVTVFLQQRAVEGAANDALVALLAKHFMVAKRDVSIIRGHTSKIKHLRIDRS